MRLIRLDDKISASSLASRRLKKEKLAVKHAFDLFNPDDRAGKKFMASAMREGWGQTKARSASSEAERSYQPMKKPRSTLSETDVMSTSSDAERATSHGNDGVLLRPRGGSNMITTGCCVQPQMCTAEPRGPSGMLGNGFYSSCCLGCCENDAPAPAEIRGGGYDSQSESGDDSGNEPEGSQIEDTEFDEVD